MYARGMTVREIKGHLEELYGIGVSPDLISRVTAEVLDEVKAWQSRPLDPLYMVVFFDALRVKIRDEGVVRNKAVYLALGVRTDGTKEILGLWIEQNEGAKFWLLVINELKNRGRVGEPPALRRAEEPRDQRHSDRGGRWTQRIPRSDQYAISENSSPDMHRPSLTPQPEIRGVQGAQAGSCCAQGHLSGTLS